MRQQGPWQDHTDSQDCSAALFFTLPCLPFCGGISVVWVYPRSAWCKSALSKKSYFYSEAGFQPKLKFLNSSMALLSKYADVGGRGVQRHMGFLHSFPQQHWWRSYSTSVPISCPFGKSAPVLCALQLWLVPGCCGVQTQ